MMQFNEIITKSKLLLDEINKIGASEGGGPLPHEAGPFGNTYPRRDADGEEDTDLPENVENEVRPHFKGENFIKNLNVGDPNIQAAFGSQSVEARNDNYFLPSSQATADNCTEPGQNCPQKLQVEKRKRYDIGTTAQTSIDGNGIGAI